MKRKKNFAHPLRTGLFTAVAAFLLLSFLAGGLVEVSREVGTLRWLLDTGVYLVANKFGQKFAASAVIGVGACFISSMIAYGKSVKSKRNHAMRVQFVPTDNNPGVGKIA